MITMGSATVGLAILAGLTVPPGSAVAAGSEHTENQHQQITWHLCDLGGDDETGRELDRAGGQCGEVVVPRSGRPHPANGPPGSTTRPRPSSCSPQETHVRHTTAPWSCTVH
jgi:hypothetical protein